MEQRLLRAYEKLPRDGLVDGVPLASQSECRIPLVSPRNARTIGSISAGCEADVERAVVSSRTAFESGRWSRLSPGSRKQRLHRFADLIEREAALLDAIDALEMGKPLSTAAFCAAGAGGFVRFCAEAIDKVTGDTLPSDAASLVVQRLFPRGVVAAITPWNFPTFNALLKVAPALAAGNAVVLKPSELSPTSAARLAELAVEADIPPGVFNLISGSGPAAGAALALHGAVDMIAFTGSTEVGGKMLQYAGQSNLKTVVAECGGKSPQIVFGDGVDLQIAADAIAQSILLNQGQVCSAGTRLLVQRHIEEEMVELVNTRLKRTKIGDPLDPQTQFGPLVSARQLTRVEDFIRRGCDEGARIACGGGRVHEQPEGFFIEPTVFVDVDPKGSLAQQEIFGPVLAVIPFADVDEAIELANGTAYGLAGYCWTSRLETGMKVAHGVRSALNIVNSGVPGTDGPGHAFSGEPFAMSGVGVEGGVAGVISYMRRQLIWYNY